jgi:uncharacterized membrane protein YbhN (UPF0104 family)
VNLWQDFTRMILAPWLRRSLWWAFYLALLAGLYIGAQSLPWRAVLRAMSDASPTWLAVAVLINAVGLPLWATQWFHLAPREDRQSWWRFIEIVAVVGAAQNTFTTVGGGASAIVLLISRGGFSRRHAVSLYALDQVLTGIGKILVVGLTLLLLPLPIWRGAKWLALSVAAATLLLVGVVGMNFIKPVLKPSRRIIRIAHFLRAEVTVFAPFVIRACGWPLALVFARKFTEVATAVAVQLACGIPVSVNAAIVVTAAIDLATVIPSTPGSVGVFEAAVLFVYGFFGVSPAVALSAAFLQHAAHLLPAIGFGYVVLLLKALPLERTRSAARK